MLHENKARSRWTGTSCFVFQFPLPAWLILYHVTGSCKEGFVSPLLPSSPHPSSIRHLTQCLTTKFQVLCCHHVLFTLLSTRRVPVSELSINRLENLSTSPGGSTIRAVLDSLDFPAYKVRMLCYCLGEVQGR